MGPKITSWWLNQPIWKIWVKMGSSSSIFGVKINNVWKHHLDYRLKEIWKASPAWKMAALHLQKPAFFSCSASISVLERWGFFGQNDGLAPLKLTANAPENRPFGPRKERSILRCENVSFRECKHPRPPDSIIVSVNCSPCVKEMTHRQVWAPKRHLHHIHTIYTTSVWTQSPFSRSCKL